MINLLLNIIILAYIQYSFLGCNFILFSQKHRPWFFYTLQKLTSLLVEGVDAPQISVAFRVKFTPATSSALKTCIYC